MGTLKENKNDTDVRRQKIYKACLSIILGPEELSEDVKCIFRDLECHEPLEQFFYDMIFLYGKGGKPHRLQDFVEKCAAAYYVHSMLNEKLDRSHYLRNEMRDDFLLDCIIREAKAKNRQLDIPDISDNELKEQIYNKFKNTTFEWGKGELVSKNPDDQYDNFDEYIKFLFTKKRNGLIEIRSFNYLWSRLNLHRDNTFFSVRPIQTELYIFCFALALDYDVYCKLRHMLEREFAESSEAEREKKFRKNFKGFTDTKRDVILREYLEAVWVRLNCARNAANGMEDSIPEMMIDFVDSDLNRYKDEKQVDIKALTKKTGKSRHLIY